MQDLLIGIVCIGFGLYQVLDRHRWIRDAAEQDTRLVDPILREKRIKHGVSMAIVSGSLFILFGVLLLFQIIHLKP